MSNTSWYQDGLHFECAGCGGCCTGAPGYVWVTRAEVTTLAAALDMDEAQFSGRFVRRVGNRYSLVELPNGDCVFFDPTRRGCRVYASRPRQCRTWPFWASNLRGPRAWADMASHCPGAGRGQLHSAEEIDALKSIMRI